MPRRHLALFVTFLAVSTNAHGRDIFSRAGLAKEISADPFAGAGGSEADTQVEPHIAVDPNDPSIVVAVFQQGRFSGGGCVDTGFATSHDGGRTWTTGSLLSLTVAVGGPFALASDPVVAVGPDGAVYAQSLVLSLGSCRTGVVVQRSDDGGLTFNAPVLVQDDTSCNPFVFNDKNWIAVDVFPGSPHRARVYSAWDRSPDALGVIQPTVLRYSDDRGETWSALVEISNPSSSTIGALPLVQPNGDLTVVYDAFVPDIKQVSQTSHDGGMSFDPPVTIAQWQGRLVPGMRTGENLPAAAVDPVTGHLYAVWADARFRTDGSNDIVMSASTNGGASWGAVEVVNGLGPAGGNRFTPAVAAYDGSVLVSFALRKDDESKVYMRYVASADSGGTFGRERRLGSPGRLDFAATAGGLLFLGDYVGLAVSADSAHAVWCRPSRPRVAFMHHQTTWSTLIRR